ncbi:HAT dimerization domain, Ribonuclease H-like domain protein [Artemisia annua]|uniref:HAT dimerization domain, Ribonuclease H-like domain protein n=1 Tax=Artemisia annua TaxID=35608 RepID=A0A2U1N368_ARTAN|nr:HAT dimerization domain, Ribonuclease H-like domain protein [Artemisia annua]
MTIALHCLGLALTPRFYDKNYLSTKASGGIPRKPPNEDKEVTNGVIEAFKRISENEEEAQMLRAQYARFHMKKGFYSRPEAQIDAVTTDPIDWWFSESYKEGPSKKWDMNLESAYLEASASRMEDMQWENLDED